MGRPDVEVVLLHGLVCGLSGTPPRGPSSLSENASKDGWIDCSAFTLATLEATRDDGRR